MGDLIFLIERRKNPKEKALSLTQMIEEFSRERSRVDLKKIRETKTLSPEKFKKALELKIYQSIVEQRKIERENFLCSAYIADLLTDMIHPEKVESWSGIDYLIRYEKEKNTILLKKGADICFFYYAYFLDQNIAQIKITKDIGSRLYFLLYYAESSAVAFYMGKNFPFMGKIAHQSLKEI